MNGARLRTWNSDDAGLILGASRTTDLREQVRLDSDSEAAAREWLTKRAGHDPARRRSFAIDIDGGAVGEVGLHAIDHVHAVAMVGYWLAPDVRGAGLATRATVSIVAWAFEELGLHRIELGHRVVNITSGHVATRCGFTFEGVERSRLEYDGVRYDVAKYGRLRTDPGVDVELVEVAA